MEIDRDGERKEREGERRMQSDAPHIGSNRDSSVSVVTVEKLIAGPSFRGAQHCLPVSHSAHFALPAGSCVASVCYSGRGAVNQQLARYKLAIEAAK